jgi:hypothetical protein
MYKLELPAVVDKNGSWYLVVASRQDLSASGNREAYLLACCNFARI